MPFGRSPQHELCTSLSNIWPAESTVTCVLLPHLLVKHPTATCHVVGTLWYDIMTTGCSPTFTMHHVCVVMWRYDCLMINLHLQCTVCVLFWTLWLHNAHLHLQCTVCVLSWTLWTTLWLHNAHLHLQCTVCVLCRDFMDVNMDKTSHVLNYLYPIVGQASPELRLFMER